jgi:microcystin-dependent protein
MDNPFIGQVGLFAFNFAPVGWAACEGQLLPINQYQALFALLGTTFGGNGQTDFALPDLRGKAPGDGLTYYIALQGIFPSRQ